jgi:hypothetical protein
VPDEEDPGGGQRRQRDLVVVVAGAAAVAYALVAAATTAFSGPANVLTAIPIVTLAVLVIIRWPLRPRPTLLTAEGPHPFRAWVVLFAALVLWELAEYAARGSRADHPTLSSMLDAVDRYYVLKALVFFGWLYLGGAIVRRGTPKRERAPSL